jgi:hypothetical protein
MGGLGHYACMLLLVYGYLANDKWCAGPLYTFCKLGPHILLLHIIIAALHPASTEGWCAPHILPLQKAGVPRLVAAAPEQPRDSQSKRLLRRCRFKPLEDFQLLAVS